MKAGSPLSVRTLSLGLFFVIFGDVFVDLRREFQVSVYIARIWIFWIRADGKLLLLLKLKHLLTAWRYTLWILLVRSMPEPSLHPDWRLGHHPVLS